MTKTVTHNYSGEKICTINSSIFFCQSASLSPEQLKGKVLFWTVVKTVNCPYRDGHRWDNTQS